MENGDKILIQRIASTVKAHPDRPALRFSDREYSYAELWAAASSFAWAVDRAGEGAPVVALMAGQDRDTYAAILGILMAGKGYLPLNPSFPAKRNRLILEKSATGTIINCPGHTRGLEEILAGSKESYHVIVNEGPGPIMVGEKVREVIVTGDEEGGYAMTEVSPEDIAYLLFTSGSTGEPKGVAVSNRNVTAYLDNLFSLYSFSPGDRFTQTFDLTFDLSVHDLFVCWSAGACLCIPDDNSSFGLSRYMKGMQPTVWFSVPSVALLMDRMRLLKEGAFPWLRMSFFCGEALLEETAAAWQKAAPGSTVVNLYGPTEATIAVSAYRLPEKMSGVKARNGIVSIGRPFPGHRYRLQDEDNGRGMLCLTGPQVVEGYYHDQRLTEEYFFNDETPYLFYNTGDLVEADEKGDLYFLGRADSEVKISGYRVNLLEIDHVINAIEWVKQAATLYLDARDSGKVLVAFVAGPADKTKTSLVYPYCRRSLPPYMVPEKIIFVEALPLNPNGKTDRRALADIFKKEYEQGN